MIRFTMRLPMKLYEKIKLLAYKEDMTIANYIRYALKKHIEKERGE